jgi:hypothetical protein
LALSLRLKAGDKRDAALQAIEGRLAEQSSSVVKADRLIACWHSFRLLHGATVDDKGKLSDAPPFCYGHFDKAWSQRVQRVNKGKADEHWNLLPGLEAECMQAYKSALDNGTNREGCMDAASGLKRQLADRHLAAELGFTQGVRQGRAAAGLDRLREAARPAMLGLRSTYRGEGLPESPGESLLPAWLQHSRLAFHSATCPTRRLDQTEWAGLRRGSIAS